VFGKLGPTGVLGVILVLVGVGMVALENLIIGAGVAFVLAGVGLVATGLVRSAMASFGIA
jgi:hypothetical protein